MSAHLSCRTAPDAAAAPVVVMGVSGVGKTTVGRILAERTGASFVDADDLHDANSVARMSTGIALTDADRLPWLNRVGAALAEHPPVVVACSALKRSYRDVLRSHAPNAVFLSLRADEERVAEQAASRTGHFMPVSLLRSQLATFEPLDADEAGATITVDADPAELAERFLRGRATGSAPA